MAPVLVLAVAATAVAGGAVIGGIAAQALPGAQNPGQPLEGANLECMSPPEAAAYLTDHGYVVPGAFLGDGQLIMIVARRDGATGTGACYGDPMP